MKIKVVLASSSQELAQSQFANRKESLAPETEIADSWPKSLDDTAAQEEWGWKREYDLAAMTIDMLQKLGKRYAEGDL